MPTLPSTREALYAHRMGSRLLVELLGALELSPETITDARIEAALRLLDARLPNAREQAPHSLRSDGRCAWCGRFPILGDAGCCIGSGYAPPPRFPAPEDPVGTIGALPAAPTLSFQEAGRVVRSVMAAYGQHVPEPTRHGLAWEWLVHAEVARELTSWTDPRVFYLRLVYRSGSDPLDAVDVLATVFRTNPLGRADRPGGADTWTAKIPRAPIPPEVWAPPVEITGSFEQALIGMQHVLDVPLPPVPPLTADG